MKNLPSLLSSLAIMSSSCANGTVVQPVSESKFSVSVSDALSPCENKTESGLGYTIIKQGTGIDFTDGVFTISALGFVASSSEKYMDMSKRLVSTDNYDLEGQSEGLKLMRVGGIAKFCIPASLAYGTEKAGPIPANSDLIEIFEIHDLRPMNEIQDAVEDVRNQLVK